jgi:hypothetical protein
MRAIASKTQAMSLVSKSGTAHGSMVGGRTAGAADANSVRQQLLNTQSRVDWSWNQSNLSGLDWSWYVAWSWGKH